MLPTDWTGSLIACGIKKAAETEGMSTRNGGGPVEGVNAHRTAYVLDLAFHYLITTHNTNLSYQLEYQPLLTSHYIQSFSALILVYNSIFFDLS